MKRKPSEGLVNLEKPLLLKKSFVCKSLLNGTPALAALEDRTVPKMDLWSHLKYNQSYV